MKPKKEIDYSSLEIDDIDYSDAPDFCDAYFCYGEYTDGTEIEEEVLEELSRSDAKYAHIYNAVY
jgi:hypothetical protein